MTGGSPIEAIVIGRGRLRFPNLFQNGGGKILVIPYTASKPQPITTDLISSHVLQEDHKEVVY